jgi:lysozyme
MVKFRISENGRKLLEHFEGRKKTAYLCSAGIPTIGIGHTKGVRLGDTATDDQIDRWFYEDIIECENAVNDIELSLYQHQFDALVLFVFNLGINALKGSTLLKKIRVNAGSPEVRDQFMRWNKARNKKGELVVVEGLTNRRAAEANMFINGYFKTDNT